MFYLWLCMQLDATSIIRVSKYTDDFIYEVFYRAKIDRYFIEELRTY